MDLFSINSVADKLGLSVHQLRRWELMFSLEIRRGRGQQRQYRAEDVSVLERIKELVEQGWPTSQIRPQLEAEGLLTPKLIGLPSPVGDQEILVESVVGLRSFVERKFIDLSRQIEELRQLFITISLRQELQDDLDSPWQPLSKELTSDSRQSQAEEIAIGPNIGLPAIGMPMSPPIRPAIASANNISQINSFSNPPAVSKPIEDDFDEIEEIDEIDEIEEVDETDEIEEIVPVSPVMPVKAEIKAPPATAMGLGEITDQNYLTILGRALDLVSWTDEQADNYSNKNFNVAHWDELGRSQAERLINHLAELYEGKTA
jgi:DNA-binding transcriptional MerR regulator